MLVHGFRQCRRGGRCKEASPRFRQAGARSCQARNYHRTTRIRLGSAVTVLSSDDPVRVFQRFATLDAVSNGRAEIIVGRGSFTESFPLFGYDLNQYEDLFEENLELFVNLLTEQPFTW